MCIKNPVREVTTGTREVVPTIVRFPFHKPWLVISEIWKIVVIRRLDLFYKITIFLDYIFLSSCQKTTVNSSHKFNFALSCFKQDSTIYCQKI